MSVATLEQPLADRPEHVPAELVRDVDLFNLPGAREDVHVAWKRIQTEMPRIYWTPRNKGYWMITRAKDIIQMQLDDEHFSMKGALVPNNPRPFPAPPLDIDPPEHAAYRLLVSPAFSPKVINSVEGAVRDYVIQSIESFVGRGECEFVMDFAKELPVIVFLTMVGLPIEDRFQLMPNADIIAQSNNPEEIHEARLQLMEYVRGKVEERRANPVDDIITKVINADINGKPIDPDYALGMCTLLVSGGLDTVRNMMCYFAKFLATHPDHVKQLIDNPELIPNAVEELFRRHGVSNTARLVRKDVEFCGVQLKAGDQIQGVSALVGLDDETVPDPMRVDFTRPAPIPHATFGNGPHRCPGSILARAEMRIFMEEWFKRIPVFGLKPGTRPDQNAGMVNNIRELWLSWPKPSAT